ncbi:hypothetical protein SAY86_016001 [Trapa natans]|uniref:GATA-type domain-containing protein n=1 Tax=Trapa natans TaxID=22666 RepID=A0AAN7LC82_TRANT|nr:hypothetical protein SAY86_016001 [Trapa natans]
MGVRVFRYYDSFFPFTLIQESMVLDEMNCHKTNKKDEKNNSGNINLKSCADCKTTKTPLWRGGPSGPKEEEGGLGGQIISDGYLAGQKAPETTAAASSRRRGQGRPQRIHEDVFGPAGQ